LDWGYEVEALCAAIRGRSITAHNQGYNDRGQCCDGLQVILRDSDQIDRFIRNCHYPPRLLSEADRKTQANRDVLQEWAKKKMTEGNNHART